MKQVAESMKAKKEALQAVETKYRELMLLVPQIPVEHAPRGGEEANTVTETIGEPTQFSFTPKDHIELGKDLDIIDFDRGVKLMGTRGYVLKNQGAELEMALMRYALDFLAERGFSQVAPPVNGRISFL